MTDDERRRLAYHEAGHAIACCLYHVAFIHVTLDDLGGVLTRALRPLVRRAYVEHPKGSGTFIMNPNAHAPPKLTKSRAMALYKVFAAGFAAEYTVLLGCPTDWWKHLGEWKFQVMPEGDGDGDLMVGILASAPGLKEGELLLHLGFDLIEQREAVEAVAERLQEGRPLKRAAVARIINAPKSWTRST